MLLGTKLLHTQSFTHSTSGIAHLRVIKEQEQEEPRDEPHAERLGRARFLFALGGSVVPGGDQRPVVAGGDQPREHRVCARVHIYGTWTEQDPKPAKSKAGPRPGWWCACVHSNSRVWTRDRERKKSTLT